MSFPNSQSNPASAIPVWVVPAGSFAGLALLGYQQITGLTTVKNMTAPAGTTIAVINPEGGNLRWRADGTVPTGDVGMPIWGTSQFVYSGTMADLDLIRMTGSDSAIANVMYYGVAP